MKTISAQEAVQQFDEYSRQSDLILTPSQVIQEAVQQFDEYSRP
jgi:hypothetical protein